MLTRLLSAGLVLALAPPAFGQADPVEPAEIKPIQIIQSITMDDLRFLLDELGAQFVAAGRTGDGVPLRDPRLWHQLGQSAGECHRLPDALRQGFGASRPFAWGRGRG